ncbi:VCBS repeat-containing protein [candidate division KSB1 bacterium]|nr:VCBS repeat-containing protein [candidate division KSB1 bacterium]
MKKRWVVAFKHVLFGCIIFERTVFAQFDLLPDLIIPPIHSVDAKVSAVIQLPFNAPLDMTGIDEKVFIIGKLTGVYTGDFSLDPSLTILEFQTSRPFHPGEEIVVLLTDEIESATGIPITAPFQWSFTVGAPYGAGDFQKYPPFSLNGESEPFAICPVDLNQDGFVDLITANNATNTVSVFRNDFQSARGGFYINAPYSVGAGPMTVRAADINQDDLPDIIVPNFYDNTITVLRNAGNLSFNPYQLIALQGTRPIDIILEDFNNDHLADMAVALFGSDSIEVFMNTGLAFQSMGTLYRVDQSGVVALASADLDKDGDKDIIAACWGSMSLVRFENTSGLFSITETISLEFSPSAVVAANLFNVDDGEMDILCTGQNSDKHAIIENINGVFQLPNYLSNPHLPVNAVCGNYIGDTHPELSVAVTNIMDDQVHIFSNDGSTLNPFNVNRENANATPMGLGQADFDLDGDIDLIVTNVQDDQVTFLENIYSPGDFYVPIVDFGDVCVGNDSVKTVDFINTTSVIVTINSIALTDYSNFSKSSIPLPVSVFPNDKVSIDITFHPTDMIFYHKGLVIETDYIHVSSVTVALFGQGIDVILISDPPDLDFGIVPPNLTKDKPLVLKNNGNANALVHLTFTGPGVNFYTNIGSYPIPVPAYGQSAPITIYFRPTAEQVYDGQIEITYTPCQEETLFVPLHGVGSSNAPYFKSDSVISVIEDIPDSYPAEAVDPDGEPVSYEFLNPLPSYTNRSTSNPANLDILAQEGDRDSQFTVVASDGFLETEWNVTIHVIPVNDPPVLEKLNRFTNVPEDVSVVESITAGKLLEFTLWAHDPEDSLIQIDYITDNLPSPPGWKPPPPGRNKRIFSWQSDFDDEGSYSVIFQATDSEVSSPLSVTDTAYIEVNRALPDLSIEEFNSTDGSYSVFKGQQKTFEVTVLNTDAPVSEPFKLFMSGMNTINPSAPIVISELGIDESVTHSFTVMFNRTGHIQLCALVDSDDEIEELDETNNELCLTVNVNEGALQVYPNPFTPNQDGFNDRAGFDVSELNISHPTVKVFSFTGFLVRTINTVSNNILEWDGRDSSGNEMSPGVYLFVVYNGDNKEASGSIVLAR